MKVKSNSIWTKNFIFLMLSNALLFMAFEMLTPTLPLLAESIGCTPSQIGLVVGAFTISAVIIRPFASQFIRFMDKKYILLIGVLVCMLATGSYMFSISLLTLLVFRLAHGLGFGIASTYNATLVTEELPRNRIGEGLGYYGVGETICMSVGPMIGIGVLNRFGFSTLFTAGTSILLVTMLIVLGTKKHKIQKTDLTKNEFKKKPFKLIEKRVLPQSLMALLMGIIVGGIMSYLTLFAKQLELNNVAWFFFISAIMGVLVRPISGKIFDKKGPLYILFPGGVILMIAMFIIAYSQTELQLNIASIFYGVGFGVIFPAIQAWVMNLVEPESREDAMSSFLNCFDIGVGGGSLFLGVISEVFSYKMMFLSLAIIIIMYLALTICMAKSIKNKTIFIDCNK